MLTAKDFYKMQPCRVSNALAFLSGFVSDEVPSYFSLNNQLSDRVETRYIQEGVETIAVVCFRSRPWVTEIDNACRPVMIIFASPDTRRRFITNVPSFHSMCTYLREISAVEILYQDDVIDEDEGIPVLTNALLNGAAS